MGTAATAIRPDCRCGHRHADHTTPGLAPQCTALSCSCLQYRTAASMLPAHRPPADATPLRAHTPLRSNERCTCGHGRKPHAIAGFEPGCAVGECKCEVFVLADGPKSTAAPRPVATSTTEPERVGAADPEPPAPEYSEPADETLTIEQLLERGRASELAAIVKLSDRIAELVEDLRERLADEAAATGVKRLVAELEKQLTDAREKLRDVGRGRRKTPPATNAEGSTPKAGQHACPDCDRTFNAPQGLGAHRSRAHGYRKAR